MHIHASAFGRVLRNTITEPLPLCAVDVSLPQASLMFMNSVLSVVGGLALIVLSTPAVCVAVVPLFAVYYRVQVLP